MFRGRRSDSAWLSRAQHIGVAVTKAQSIVVGDLAALKRRLIAWRFHAVLGAVTS